MFLTDTLSPNAFHQAQNKLTLPLEFVEQWEPMLWSLQNQIHMFLLYLYLLAQFEENLNHFVVSLVVASGWNLHLAVKMFTLKMSITSCGLHVHYPLKWLTKTSKVSLARLKTRTFFSPSLTSFHVGIILFKPFFPSLVSPSPKSALMTIVTFFIT